MTQKEFAKEFKKYMGSKKTLSQAEKDVKGFVETLKLVLSDLPEDEKKIVFTGLGAFIVKRRKKKQVFHPTTNEPITISAREKVTFKSSSLLDAIINKKG